MKRMLAVGRGVVIAAILGVLPGVAAAQTTQTVQYQVSAINVIAFAGAPTLTISAATPGFAPNPATSTGVTWAVTTNQSNARVTARLNLALPAGLTITAELQPPTGAASTGTVTLSTTAQDVVTGVTRVAEGGLGVTYVLTATSAAGAVSGTATITYTITGGV